MLDTLIQKKIEMLPDHIQYAIHHFDWTHVISNLAKKYKLNISDEEVLHREIMLFIVGLLSPEEFSHDLMSKFYLSREELSKMIEDINTEISIPIQNIAFSEETKQALRELKKQTVSSDKKEEEKDLSESIKRSFEDEGLILVDEESDEKKPNTELQKIADQLFSKTENFKGDMGESSDEKKDEGEVEREISTDSSLTKKEEMDLPSEEEKRNKQKEDLREFHPEPEKEDYLGVFEHRTQTGSEKKKLGFIPKKEKHITPVEKKIDIPKNKDFLRKIGAI